jgi:hypothetical protein
MKERTFIACVGAAAFFATTALFWVLADGPAVGEAPPSGSPQERQMPLSSALPTRGDAVRRQIDDGLATPSDEARSHGTELDLKQQSSPTRQLSAIERGHAKDHVRRSIQSSEERLLSMRSNPVSPDLRQQYRDLQNELSEQRDLEMLRVALAELQQGGGFMLRTGHSPEAVAGDRRFYASVWHGPQSPFQGVLVVLPASNSSLDDLEHSFREARRAEAELLAQEFNQMPYEKRRTAVDAYFKSGVPASISMEHDFMGLVDVDSLSAVIRVRH